MSEYGFRYTEDYLKHHQVLGAKWHKRRYQNYDGSLTEEGRIHYGVGPARDKKAEKEKVKKEKEEAKEAKKAAKKEAKIEAKEMKKNHGQKIADYRKMTEEEVKQSKEKALKTGNVNEIAKNIQSYSKQELDDVYNLIQSRKKITDLTKENIKTGEQKLREWATKLESITKITNSGIAIYNNIAKTSNTFGETNLKIIQGNTNNQNKPKK